MYLLVVLCFWGSLVSAQWSRHLREGELGLKRTSRARQTIAYADGEGSASFSAFPSVVYLLGGRIPCSGVLLKNSTIVTAGVCLSSTVTTDDGEQMSPVPSIVVFAGGGTNGVVTKAGARGDGNYVELGTVNAASYIYNPGKGGRNLALLAFTPIVPAPTTLPEAKLFFESSSGDFPTDFPFSATFVGFGSSEIASVTIGLQRFAGVSVVKQEHVVETVVLCDVDVRGGEYVVEHSTPGVGPRICESDWGGGLFWSGSTSGDVVLVGVAARRDDIPCSDEQSWFQSIPFQQTWLQTQLAVFGVAEPIVCPSATPSPSPTAASTPTATPILPSVTPSPSTSSVFDEVVIPPEQGLTDAEIAMIAIAVLFMVCSCIGFTYWYIFLRPVHHKVVATNLGTIVVPAEEDDLLLVQERKSIKETVQNEKRPPEESSSSKDHDHDGEDADCKICAYIRADKEKKRQAAAAMAMVHDVDAEPLQVRKKPEADEFGVVLLSDGDLGAGEGGDAMQHSDRTEFAAKPKPSKLQKSNEQLLKELEESHKTHHGPPVSKSTPLPGRAPTIIVQYRRPEDVTPTVTSDITSDLLSLMRRVDDECITYAGREADVLAVHESTRLGDWSSVFDRLGRMDGAQREERLRRRQDRRAERRDQPHTANVLSTLVPDLLEGIDAEDVSTSSAESSPRRNLSAGGFGNAKRTPSTRVPPPRDARDVRHDAKLSPRTIHTLHQKT